MGGFILANEMFTAEERIYAAPTARIFDALGMLSLVIFTYFIRNWRTLQFSVSIATLITAFYWW